MGVSVGVSVGVMTSFPVPSVGGVDVKVTVGDGVSVGVSVKVGGLTVSVTSLISVAVDRS